ncbi:MAG: AAA family ATPase [Anaerolineae bacterium]
MATNMPSAFESYARSYITDVMNCPEMQAPDPTASGQYHETLRILHNSHTAGGPDAARQSWTKLLELYPDLKHLAPAVSSRHMLTVDELKNLPPLEWIIPGMIPKRSLVEVHGPPGSGKSLFVLDLALSMAKRSPVIYVCVEGASGNVIRIDAWEKKYGETANPNLKFYIHSVNLLDEDEVEDFITLARPQNAELIIFDTLARCMIGGDENSARDMGMAINACDRIRDATGASILLVHHTGKSGANERGSSALRGGCDSMIEIKNDDDIITISSSKLKDGTPFETLQYVMVKYGESVVLEPRNDTERAMKPDVKLKDTDRKVLEMLALPIYTTIGAAYRWSGPQKV